MANGTSCGLSAGVCTNDMRHVHRLVRDLRCGTVNVRDVPVHRSELSPFGAIEDSGIGIKEGVVEAMKAMTHVKRCTVPWA